MASLFFPAVLQYSSFAYMMFLTHISWATVTKILSKDGLQTDYLSSPKNGLELLVLVILYVIMVIIQNLYDILLFSHQGKMSFYLSQSNWVG